MSRSGRSGTGASKATSTRTGQSSPDNADDASSRQAAPFLTSVKWLRRASGPNATGSDSPPPDFTGGTPLRRTAQGSTV